MSPDDYRRASGYRRSQAAPIGHNSAGAPIGPVQAFDSIDITSPLLREFMGGGRASAAGLTVTQKLAMKNSGFFRACNLITSSVGMLPTQLHRRKADGTTEKAKDHPLYRVLTKRPNSYQTAFEFKSFMQLVALLDGNAYARVVWGVRRGRRAVIALLPYPRGSVKATLNDDLELVFRYTPKAGGTTTLDPANVFHFRHPLSLDGVNGVSLLDMAVETLGLAAAAEKALGKLLAKGVMAAGAIEVPAELGDEAYTNLRTSMNEDHAGADNAGSWFILEQGAKANPFLNPKDSQTDETRKRQDENVARFTDVPRPLLMMDETSWGTGIRELGLFFVTYCLMKWFVAWEQAIERSCLSEAEQDAEELYVKFNDGALLRGSLKEQAEFFSKALGNNAAWMEPNEVRANFELNPRPDGEGLPKPTAAQPQTTKEPMR
ncbi:MAG: phage portal protein [Sphingomonas sp.]|uniref:phage portal protein n=1 Tax=Sphingomonas sp. TaxID=28214 RepID=UPI000DBC3429|nr:phage portal protein [Sphingomonas sp.]PZU77746.1 MAG: phage portal protein [Sphingomonas sp.]